MFRCRKKDERSRVSTRRFRLNPPGSRSQGFRQSPFQKTSPLAPGGARSEGCVVEATAASSLASSGESPQEAGTPDEEGWRPFLGQEGVGIGGPYSARMTRVPWMDAGTRPRNQSCALPVRGCIWVHSHPFRSSGHLLCPSLCHFMVREC